MSGVPGTKRGMPGRFSTIILQLLQPTWEATPTSQSIRLEELKSGARVLPQVSAVCQSVANVADEFFDDHHGPFTLLTTGRVTGVHDAVADAGSFAGPAAHLT